MEHLSGLETTVESCQTHGPFLRKSLWVSSPRSLCFVPRDWAVMLGSSLFESECEQKNGSNRRRDPGSQSPITAGD